MIVAGVAYGGLRAVSTDRLTGLRNTLNAVRARSLSRIGAPSCTSATDSLPADACVRRQLLYGGGYWPRAAADLLSDDDNRTAVRTFQRDLGVSVDGRWGRDTQAALERVLGGPIPESVPPGGWGGPRIPDGGGSGGGDTIVLPGTGGGTGGPAEGTRFALAGVGVILVALGGAALWYFLRKKKR